jgi:hypothetical protein
MVVYVMKVIPEQSDANDKCQEMLGGEGERKARES